MQLYTQDQKIEQFRVFREEIQIPQEMHIPTKGRMTDEDKESDDEIVEDNTNFLYKELINTVNKF